MQVEPIRPVFKAPEPKRSNLQVEEPLPIFAFRFKLRRYSEAAALIVSEFLPEGGKAEWLSRTSTRLTLNIFSSSMHLKKHSHLG